MRRKVIGTLAAAGIAVGLVGGAPPASALTAEGTAGCLGGGATGAVYGEQQRLGDTLTLTLHHTIIFQGSGLYNHFETTNFTGTLDWSAQSESLLIHESYGTCVPPA